MADMAKPGPSPLVVIRSLIYFAVFYIVTALYLVVNAGYLYAIGPAAPPLPPAFTLQYTVT